MGNPKEHSGRRMSGVENRGRPPTAVGWSMGGGRVAANGPVLLAAKWTASVWRFTDDGPHLPAVGL